MGLGVPATCEGRTNGPLMEQRDMFLEFDGSRSTADLSVLTG